MSHFEDAFFNVYVEGKATYVESTCNNIELLASRIGRSDIERDEDLCRLCLGSVSIEDVIEMLKGEGVPEERIAVNNEPLSLEVESGFKGKKVLVCPVCGSTDIVVANIAGLLPPLYRCLKCGYIGRIVLEVEAPSPEKEG